jgi:hypothetical protein
MPGLGGDVVDVTFTNDDDRRPSIGVFRQIRPISSAPGRSVGTKCGRSFDIVDGRGSES